ncbi:hypothetical protein KC354_g18528, partial [Hortaea werneckii]
VNQPPPDQPTEVSDAHLRATGADWPLNATDEELQEAMSHDPTVAHETSGSDIAASKAKNHGSKGSRVLHMFKSSVKGTVETALGADHLKAKAGSEHAKHRLGVVPHSREENLSGPVDFKARFHGRKGHAYLSVRATIPCLSFSVDKGIGTSGSAGKSEEELHPVWSVAVADIKEVRK